jgi:hypothetical protein
MQTLIKQISLNASKSFLSVSKNGAKNVHEFEINCAELQDWNHADIRDSENYSAMFKVLSKIQGPCLYYFEVLSENSSSSIVDSIKNYGSGLNAKAIPAIKTRISDSKILYVGKVKRSFWGRLIQHLGYYKVARTQGLQLFYWAKELNMKLKLVIFEFEPDMIELMSVLENDLAQHLKPILGKHK